MSNGLDRPAIALGIGESFDTVVARALSSLPDHFHQPLVLRELEGLSYRELSEVIGIPMGTVMSRLSRARVALRRALDTGLPQPVIPSRPRARAQEADPVLV